MWASWRSALSLSGEPLQDDIVTPQTGGSDPGDHDYGDIFRWGHALLLLLDSLHFRVM